MSRVQHLLTVVPLGAACSSCAVDFGRHFVEECANGVDDDDDGKVDCADEDCGAAACVPAAPEGWLGPFLVAYDGAACPEGANARVTGTLCGGCGCEGAVSCGPSSVSFGDAGCPAPLDQSLPVGDGACVDLGVSGGALGAKGDIPLTSAACSPTGSGGTRQATICDTSGGAGCEAPTSCFDDLEGACVTRDGDWSCPEGFPARRSLATGAVTGCGACECEPSPSSCSGTTSLFSGDACTGTEIGVLHDGLDCAVLSESPRSARFQAAEPPVCAPIGGSPIGGETLTTICCVR